MPISISADTPRISRTVAGHSVMVPAPFAEGHVCTAGEAAALNQTLAENLSNQIRKEATENGWDAARVQEEVDRRLAKGYEFGVRTGGGRGPSDPVLREALDLVAEAIKDRLTKSGVKLDKDSFKAKVQEIFDREPDRWRKMAEAQIKARASALSKVEVELG